MGVLVYAMCALTAAACAWLLLNAYGRGRYRLLLWSGLCFLGLTINNVFLVMDKVILPGHDMSLWRSGVALLSMSVLIYGLVWDTE